MSSTTIRRVVVPTLALLFAPAAAFAQQQRTLTAADYARAERQLAPATTPLVYGSGVRPTFLPDERFWYRVATPTGAEFIVVDPAKGTRTRAFDQEKVAAGLSAATGTTYTAMQLPFQTYDYTSDGSIRVRVGQRRYDCNAATGRCGALVDDREANAMPAPGPGRRGGARPQVPSPDGKRAAFIATGISGCGRRDRAGDAAHDRRREGLRLRDRQRRLDARAIAPVLSGRPTRRRSRRTSRTSATSATCISSARQVGHPELKAWKYPLPGDSVVAMIQRVIIDVDDRAR